MIAADAPPPQVDAGAVTFRLANRNGQLAAVRLIADAALPEHRLAFARRAGDGQWELRLDRPPLGRLEYLLELTYADGRVELVPDPANPTWSGLPRFARVTGFVRGVLRSGPDWRDAVPALLTCGSAEENRANNAHMARALAAQGYGARLHVHPDVHNWVSWRDVLDPCLPELAGQVWG